MSSNWYYDKDDLENTPSIRDGLDIDTERRYRKEGARFIMKCGVSLGLGHNTMATGVVFFHRFYMLRSFQLFPRYLTACSCLFLAGKVEETPKKCKDVISAARTMLTDQKFISFGRHPKEEVMTLERILLQTIKFDLQVEHPYSFVVKYAKCLKGDKLKLQKMVQMAWNFANDSFSTTVCLQWEPEIVAAALIHLSCKLSNVTVSKWAGKQPKHKHWWDMFFADLTVEIFEEICHQVLDMYKQCNSSNVKCPPQLPSSKSSIPPKRTETPSTLISSPVPDMTITTIDEELENMSIRPILQSTTTDNVNYAYPPGDATTFIQFNKPPPTINQTMKSYSVHAPQANSSNAEGPPTIPSHPSKRIKMSPTVNSSPVSTVTMPTFDEKPGSMSIRPMSKSITTHDVNYDYPPAYGTVFTDFNVPPPPLISLIMKSYSGSAPSPSPAPLPLIPISVPPPPLINQTKVYAPLHVLPPPLMPPLNRRPPNPFRQWYPRGYFQRRYRP